MYLKSIKTYGFKSFADKTEIIFGENINGIVGPNGSGKSNVVDAVRWVLGEQSVKSLRGESSTDIIFSGSKSRKPLNSASVTLVFDNTDLYLPVNYTEVSVKRVMYRSGENEYYLNNEKCRLKDITNLLTDSGADKESFNIISQGKIDEILSTKPGDRRVVFESAAGILKYKKRKEEAEKKLERTNLNIDRVNDIIKELENNLGPLERQSKDAKHFLEIKEQLTDLEISLIAYDIQTWNYQTKEMKDKIEYLKDEIVQLSNNHSSYDVQLLEKKDEIKKIEGTINEHQNTLLEVTKSIEKIDADIRLLKERKKYTESASLNQEQNLLTLKESLLKIETEMNEVRNAIQTNQTAYQEEKKKENEIQQKYFECTENKNKMNTKLESKYQELNDIKYKIEYLERTLESDNTIPGSIKNIMNNKRLAGVHNIIGKLIQVEKEYELAVYTALGSAFNYLVVDTKENAKEMVEYLKENKLGRATFFPIDVIKPRNIDNDTLNRIQNVDGFIKEASALVKCDRIYQDIISNQLGNVIICKNLECANYISKSIFNRYRIVTLDGQVVNVGGSITGGSSNTAQNRIKEKYELDVKKQEYQTLIDDVKQLESKIQSIVVQMNEYNTILAKQKTHLLNTEEILQQKIQNLTILQNKKEEFDREIKDIESITNHSSDTELENMLNLYYSAIANKDNLKSDIDSLQFKKENLEKNISEIEKISKQDNEYIHIKEKKLKELEIKLNTMNLKLDNHLISLGEEYNLTYEGAIAKYKLEVDSEIARSQVRELKAEIKNIGYVNVESIEEYEKVKERYEFLTSQREDLKKAENTLLEIIKEMDDVMKEKFITTFEKIRVEFKKVFREMFRGGEAELVLTAPDNLLETGIEIQAIPSGKNLKSITLLSGGEKTFTAISLLFAILNVRPVPFCLLDEVEAALDDANVESFGNYLYKYRNMTQFILITHKKKTMEFADILYGITMQESGVSKLVSVKLEDIEGN